jgi:DNA-binding transcriptional regulator YhcF (GntR family)
MNFKGRIISLDPEVKKPLMVQLAEELRKSIIRGVWKAGDILPSIHELARMCNTSEKVPRKALSILAKDGLIEPKRGVGSVVKDRGRVRYMNGRVLIYVRETGYSFYCSQLLTVLEENLHSKGYIVSVIRAGGKSEVAACHKLKSLLKEQWSLVFVFGGNSEGKRIITESGLLFVLVGDGTPLPRRSDPTCIGRIEIMSQKALPDFLRGCVHRNVRRVVQFKYAEGAFDLTQTLSSAETVVESITVTRKSTPEKVSSASLLGMQRFLAKNVLPDLFFFTDDYLAQGALIALAVAGVRIPEDVAVVTHANRGLGPVWVKPLSRLEMDPLAHVRVISNVVSEYLKTGVFPSGIALGSVWCKGTTF